MRILYHHRTLGDGAEGIHIAEIVEAFRSLGHDVHVLGPMPSTHSRERPGMIHRLRAAVPETLVQGAAVGYNALDFAGVSRAIDRFKPDLVYKRHGRYDVGATIAARRRGVPVLLEVNAVYSARPYRDFEPLFLQPLAERLERRAFAAASALYAVSTPMARQVAALGRPDVAVLPNGANPTRFDPQRVDAAAARRAYGREGTLVVGWTGILREWHGLDLLLNATAAIPGVDVLLVGDGPAREAVTRRATELGLASRVRITGRVAHDAIATCIAAMDVAVVVADHTGVASPMKLLEYMAMGRAVVAPRTENIRDLIEDGTDGLLFTPGNAEDLASRIQQLAADPALRARLAEGARRKVLLERNWRSIAAAALALVGKG